MTYEEKIKEAIVELKDIFINALEYKDIRTQRAFDVTFEALEKQIPKKPIEERYFGEMGSKIGFCPNCRTGQSCDDNSIQHCYYCGQAIDWSDKDDE